MTRIEGVDPRHLADEYASKVLDAQATTTTATTAPATGPDSTSRTGNFAAVLAEPIPPFESMICRGARKPALATPFSSRPR